MSGLRDKISADLKVALKARDEVRVRTLRMLLHDLKNAGLEKRARKGYTGEVDSPVENLSESEAQQVLRRALRQRRESVDEYRKGGREDLVAREEAEAAVIEEYLPKALSEAEIEGLAREAIQQTGAEGPRDMGKVMKAVLARAAGRADGKLLATVVQRLLAGGD